MDDIQGALDAGMGAILVKTGKYQPGDESKSSPSPTAASINFEHAVQFIVEHNTTHWDHVLLNLSLFIFHLTYFAASPQTNLYSGF